MSPASSRITLAWLNACSEEAFVDALGGVFEHAPWVAAQAARQRPYPDLPALHAGMLDRVRQLPTDRLKAFLAMHPELAGHSARAGRMTADSTQEQATLDLARLSPEDGAVWDELNGRYRERFGFPFILCIRRHTRDSALAAFRARLAHSPAQELSAAMDEIASISRLRLEDRLSSAP
ncbi:2-oxo-4-hydroxy-4-carboxy-5-ureidoimidazoline decarboxylase [Leptospira sp. 96542]|nr:2-oxo-4-hydroxy-4-carboxy-5-ureidoimidazoline decarboxylase [Leptospira sp. 96542]